MKEVSVPLFGGSWWVRLAVGRWSHWEVGPTATPAPDTSFRLLSIGYGYLRLCFRDKLLLSTETEDDATGRQCAFLKT